MIHHKEKVDRNFRMWLMWRECRNVREVSRRFGVDYRSAWVPIHRIQDHFIRKDEWWLERYGGRMMPVPKFRKVA